MIDVLRNKDVFLDHFLKSKKSAVFKGVNLWFLSKISVFPYLLWVLNTGRNNAEWCSGKNKAFLYHKNNHFSSPKNRIFLKGLTHDFGQKIESF